MWRAVTTPTLRPTVCSTTIIFALGYNIQHLAQNTLWTQLQNKLQLQSNLQPTCSAFIKLLQQFDLPKPSCISFLWVLQTSATPRVHPGAKAFQNQQAVCRWTQDCLIDKPYVKKYISWMTYLATTVIVLLVVAYCKCRPQPRKLLRITVGSAFQPPQTPPDSKNLFLFFRRFLPRRRDTVLHTSEEVEINWMYLVPNVLSLFPATYT